MGRHPDLLDPDTSRAQFAAAWRLVRVLWRVRRRHPRGVNEVDSELPAYWDAAFLAQVCHHARRRKAYGPMAGWRELRSLGIPPHTTFGLREVPDAR